MSAAPDLWSRLERLLHRESHAARLEHRDLMAQPLEERVERGESLAGLSYLGEDPGGRIRLRCPDNQAKFRRGDGVRLWNGDDDPEAARRRPGIAVAYDSFDDAAHSLVVVRDSWKRDGSFDPGRPLQLDPQDATLTALALEALGVLRGRNTRAAAAARAVLERRADPIDRSQDLAAARSLADDPALGLDPSKRAAAIAAIARDPVALVQGPPGSGKTFLLAHVVAALARRGERLLVTAHTHRAVNNALRKIAEIAPDLRVVKAGRETGADDLRRSPVELAPSMRRLPAPDGRATVVGTTVLGLRSTWDRPPYDRLVVDEAAQVPLAYAPCALLAAGRFLLVGDHRQLGPIVAGDHLDPLAGISVFEHLAEAYPPVMLRTTYRMNAGINDFPSRAFYGGRLEPAPCAAGRRFAAVPGGLFDAVFDPETPAVFVEVDHEGFRTRCEPEARVVADLAVDAISRQRVAPSEIAVVSPYRAQLRLIRTLVRRGLAATGAPAVLPVIDTVERIQGQEREVVIVSLCASDPDHLAGEHARFFFSPNRLNVTLTRARTKLVVVASPHLFRSLPHRMDLLAHADLFRRLRRDLPRVSLVR